MGGEGAGSQLAKRTYLPRRTILCRHSASVTVLAAKSACTSRAVACLLPQSIGCVLMPVLARLLPPAAEAIIPFLAVEAEMPQAIRAIRLVEPEIAEIVAQLLDAGLVPVASEPLPGISGGRPNSLRSQEEFTHAAMELAQVAPSRLPVAAILGEQHCE